MSKNNTIKISEPEYPCMYPEHNPPSMQVFESGTYEHTCPSCGKVQIFTIPLINC